VTADRDIESRAGVCNMAEEQQQPGFTRRNVKREPV
jgi:hypothetical protein